MKYEGRVLEIRILVYDMHFMFTDFVQRQVWSISSSLIGECDITDIDDWMCSRSVVGKAVRRNSEWKQWQSSETGKAVRAKIIFLTFDHVTYMHSSTLQF